MSSSKKNIARTLSEKLLDFPEPEWNGLIEEWCEGDTKLIKELTRLAARNRNARDFVEELQKKVYSLAQSTIETGVAVPEYIGDYKITRRLGSGGSAVVYLAEDADGTELALKLLRSSAIDSDYRQRFESESYILSNLDHPNIAKLVDSGLTDDRIPFVVMEYIDGVPIDAWCREQDLSVDETIGLFHKVCEAVHYAHQNLMVHRDIKPEHVLITKTGQIKLIDFGIAKLLDPLQAGFQVLHTQTGMRVMTPEFASPEQVRGQQVTTASDIYSLGVLLYLLLTGRHPYRFKTSSMLEIERIVCEYEPVKPSEAAFQNSIVVPKEADNPEPSKLRKTLRGDLDRIIQKAMRKEPELRYASAQAFADDLENYLRGEPVSARSPTLRYRVRKFISRHKMAVTAASIALIALTVGLIGTLWQASEAKKLAELAEIQAQRAEQASAFLVELFEESDPTKANDGSITAREMLDRGYERALAELEEKPALQAQMLGIIGKVYQNLGFYDQALPALGKAVEGYRQIGESSEEYTSVLLLLANLEYRMGELEKAEKSTREVLALKQDIYGPNHPETASVMNTLAIIYEGMDDYDNAIKLMRQVIEIRRQQPESGSNLAANLNNLAIMLQRQGEPEESDLLFGEAVEVVEQVWGENHPYMAFTLNGYAGLHQMRGDYSAAENDLKKALEIGRAVFPETHPFIAVVMHNLGKLYEEAGDLSLAAQYFKEGLELRRRSLPPSHPDIASSLDGLAVILIETGRAADAEPLLREALDIRINAFDEQDWRIAQIEAHLGRSLLRQNKRAEAEPLLIKSHTLLHKVRGADDIHTQKALTDLATLGVDVALIEP